MHLSSKQNKELKVIYEEAICTKLGFGSKFPRAVLYSNRNSIGIGLITPETVIAMLATKLYIGNKRVQTKVGHIIEIIDNIIAIKQGISNKVEKSISQNKPTWNEQINLE